MFKPEYQNIFTQVQVHGPADLGVETETGGWERGNQPWTSYWMGKIGDAQIGPLYLGLAWRGLDHVWCDLVL